MTTVELLHRAVLENPKDLTARAACADAMAESDDPSERERGALAQEMLCTHPFNSTTKALRTEEEWAAFLASGTLGFKELTAWRALFGPLRSTSYTFTCAAEIAGDAHEIVWRRGFIERVAVPIKMFTAPGFVEGLFRAHPVTKVRITDREASAGPNGRSDMFQGRNSWDLWHGPGHDNDELPAELFKPLVAAHPRQLEPGPAYAASYVEFRSQVAARLALSRICVALGRKLAGLPPL